MADRTEASIPVDLFNPGQVFACIGLVEAADVLAGDAEGVFDWSDPADVRFRVCARGAESPVEKVLAFFDVAKARAVALEGSPSIERWTASWGERPAVVLRSAGYPFPDPPSPATLVCVLEHDGQRIAIDHWGDQTARDNVKFWAGAGGYPGAGLARDALELVRGRALAAAADPFALAAPQSSSFRLDWRRDYVPIDAGFSLNKHEGMDTLGFPLVELLGAIGLTHARPTRPSWRDKLEYVYGISGRARRADAWWLPLPLLRASLAGGGALPFPNRQFRMFLSWPGQEGQARAITTVTEEASS